MNRMWRVAARPKGEIKDSDFRYEAGSIPEPAEGQVLVRTLLLSLDPANRIWLNGEPTYLPPLPLGDVMWAGGIGVVTKSRDPLFQEGDLVQGLLAWQDYGVFKASNLTRLQPNPALPLTAYLGLIGIVGFTAYFGLLDIGRPQAGETLVVSGAAGAVGSIVGQIGKIKGCRVVGIAGTDEKCRWIVDELGFDAAIQYKTEKVIERLGALCPKGIDVYFENVGGETLDAVLAHINLRARIALCGMISQYNAAKPQPGPYRLANILLKRARLEGFIVTDYGARFAEAASELGEWLAAGRIQYRIDVVEGLENAPRALKKLFDGSNTGKLIVQVASL